ncbi:hypothetical protein [Aquimarina algicola]|uniref:hypothetical protein n=1 Tax=Aquimarina algicola TaxID=2589995 RepID=UPI001CF3518E|nr:hypothetical protein [Aquimarina algicola]
MKNLLLLLSIVSIFLVACEKSDINEETGIEFDEKDTPTLYKIDKGDIIRPGDKPN